MREEVASVPQKLDPSLFLELEGKVHNLIQVFVGLLDGGTFWCNVPGMYNIEIYYNYA